MSRAFAVVNPAAGGGRTERVWRGLRDELTRSGLAIEWAASAAPGDATALARRAALAGWTLVVAVGGDGTLNEVVNGVVDADGRALVSVGFLATGRGSDACPNFGLAAEPIQAARRLLIAHDTRFDLGVAAWPDGTRRYFLNTAGAGFDAVVARRVAARGGSGTLPYVRGVVGAIARHRAVDAAIEVDGRPAWSGRLAAAVVANGPCFGGGMRIAPAADPGDGLLDLVVLGDVGRWELLWWLPTVYRGEHVANRKVVSLRGREVRIRAGAPLPTQLDGEAMPATPVTLTVLPGALPLRR